MGNCHDGKKSEWEYVRVGNCRVVNSPVEYCRVGNCHGGKMSGGKMSGCSILSILLCLYPVIQYCLFLSVYTLLP